MYLSKDFTEMRQSGTNEGIDMRKLYINEKSAALHSGSALATQYCSEENTSRYISVEDIISTLQAEANKIAGDLMANELSPSPEAEIDRRYHIGKWDKLNELLYLFSNV